MNNKDLPMLVAVAKAVSGSSGGGSSLPEPVTTDTYSGDTLLGVTTSGGAKSWKVINSIFQIAVRNSGGTYSIYPSRCSKNIGIKNLLSMFGSDIDINISNIVLRWMSGNLPGDTNYSTAKAGFKCSGYSISQQTGDIQLHFPYSHISENNTLVKGLFVVTLSGDNDKSVVYYPET